MLKVKHLEKMVKAEKEEREKAIKTAKEEREKAIKAEKEEKEKILKTVENSLKILGKRGHPNSQGSVKISASKAADVVKQTVRDHGMSWPSSGTASLAATPNTTPAKR